MPNVEIPDLLAAQATLLSPLAAQIGAVLTSERYATNRGWINLFESANIQDGHPEFGHRGVMILWDQLVSQRKGPRVGTISLMHRFTYEFVYPFNDRVDESTSSKDLFTAQVMAVVEKLNTVQPNYPAPWDLGLNAEFPDNEIEHELLQGRGAVQLREWNTGSTTVTGHYTQFTLDVRVTNLYVG